MSPLISLVPVVVFFLIVPCCYAAYIKLSARLLHRSKARWKHGFLFGLLLCVLAVAGRMTSLALGHTLPLPIGLFVGLVLHLLLGGWFFSTRATDAAGHALGWPGAIKLSALTFLLLATTAFALMGAAHILFALNPQTQP
jgi:hypothetical protein